MSKEQREADTEECVEITLILEDTVTQKNTDIRMAVRRVHFSL